MSNPWGSGSYGIGEYGTGLENVDVFPTGIGASISLGNETTTAEVNEGWGRVEWGNLAWGDAYSAQTGSVSAQTAIGAVSTQIDVSVLVQGIALSSAIGNETIKADAIVTPNGITLSVVTGDEATQADAIVTPNGVTLSVVTGNETIQADAIVTPSGIALTGSIGETEALTIQGTGLSTGVGLVDIQAGGNIFIQVDEHTLDTGVGLVNVEIAVEVFQEGMQLNTFIGDEEAFTDVTVSPAGIALAIAEPEIVVDLNTPVDVTGTEIISTTGIIDANPDANAIGIGAQTSIGQVTSSANANIDVSGNVLNTSIGQVISIGNANIDVTGISLATAIGDEEAFTDVVVGVTGISATYAFGDVVIESKYSVDGINLSGAINSVTIDASAVVTPTGIGLTITAANPNIIAWAEVDVGTEVTWTPVDLAA
jgi:hypothetical protein